MASTPSGDNAPGAARSDVTGLLLAWRQGDAGAHEQLLAAIYDELRRQAARAMRREGEHTLQATALVHEAYLRLIDQTRVEWRSRAHFFGTAGQMMRRVLVDHARGRHAAKRGGERQQVTLSAADDASVASNDADSAVELMALHDALDRLAALDADQARIVELRYFGGLNIEETAEAMGSSPATVKREWAVARAWLRRELAGE
jgi:RNA polymerase sigma factor (TIGR02999 family)